MLPLDLEGAGPKPAFRFLKQQPPNFRQVGSVLRFQAYNSAIGADREPDGF